jgi:orotidine-5'-phosphate decarboxylase
MTRGGKRLSAADRLRPADRLIVALDEPTLPQALRAARRLRGAVRHVKIGSVLFTSAGPQAVARLRAMGFGIMLDLKYFDIPNTVELACRAAAKLRVELITVHAAGGADMLAAAARGARDGAGQGRRPRILAVTVLTSTAGGPAQMRRRVLALAGEALRAGCDGVVASAQEARALRRRFGTSALIVCPGIRPRTAGRDDQARVATPGQALADGASLLVIGRPITGAPDPRQATRVILKEMHEAC